MPSPSRSVTPAPGATNATNGISIRDAVLTWFAAWFVGNVLSSMVLASSGAERVADAGPWWLAASQLVAWTPLVAAIVFVSRRSGTGSLVRDFGLRARPLDLVGLPLGVATQLVFVKAVYLPLNEIWPDTFSTSKIEKPARDLWQHAHGAGLVVLVIVVAVGAPLVEELAYRGLLQRSFTRCTGAVTGVVVVAVWFALIHFQPVSIPGLFVVGIVLGVCAQRTGRLGMAITTHMAFNATGLILVANT
ncbi:MAG: type II CAAX endopeptidase family protein [Actinomycetota bacterium]|nr:type II CAAX endopeptidase family protein [Actinomycetota bacterium]